MSAKSVLFSIVVAAFIVWVLIPDEQPGPAPLTKTKPVQSSKNMAAPYQRQMEKARGVGEQLQQGVDKRMKDK